MEYNSENNITSTSSNINSGDFGPTTIMNCISVTFPMTSGATYHWKQVRVIESVMKLLDAFLTDTLYI